MQNLAFRKEIDMATKKICDICGKEIKGDGKTIKGFSNTLLGAFQIFERDLCDQCFEDVRKNTLKKKKKK